MFSKKNRLRFREKIKADKESGCWLWLGALIKGYGSFSVEGRRVYAHRYFFEYVNGKVPVGLELHHICENKSCVRPHHLEPVTHGENMARAAAQGVWSGEKNANAKLTELAVLEIKRAFALGVPFKKLAKRFKVSIRLVYYIANDEIWRHLKPKK